VAGASCAGVLADEVDCAGGEEFCAAEPDPWASVLDGRIADHSRIIAVRNVANRLGKRCPWNQAPKLLSRLDGVRRAGVVRPFPGYPSSIGNPATYNKGFAAQDW
jgi:hypothetical protein